MRWVIVFLILILSSTTTAKASSDYVLPYPSFMPGNPLYRVNLLKDEVLKYWYFGSFSQFKYNLKQTDKYLVEAKTLFEYKQYLLAIRALQRSTFYFERANAGDQLLILKKAAEKHTEVLRKLSKEVPETFIWQEEKSRPVALFLKNSIENAVLIRERNL